VFSVRYELILFFVFFTWMGGIHCIILVGFGGYISSGIGFSRRTSVFPRHYNTNVPIFVFILVSQLRQRRSVAGCERYNRALVFIKITLSTETVYFPSSVPDSYCGFQLSCIRTSRGFRAAKLCLLLAVHVVSFTVLYCTVLCTLYVYPGHTCFP
jgi:hypothetical protein